MTTLLQKVLIFGLMISSLGIGCNDGSPSLGTVIGTITMNGHPVRGLKVTFVPEAGGSPSYGGTDENGVFRLLFNQTKVGALIGKHNVLLENPEPVTDDSGNLIVLPTAKIPKKYRNAGLLSADVQPGKNDFHFEIDAKET